MRLTVLAPLLFLTGCAYVESRTADVTHDAKYHVAYTPGRTYVLKADARLIGDPSDLAAPTRLELVSPRMDDWYRRHPQYAVHLNDLTQIATIPAGSTVRVDTLDHNYTFAIPPVPGDSQILHARGTLTTPSATWTNVLIPHDQDTPWQFVPGTGVMAYHPDDDFLKPLR
jgi:hypothetical protein